MGAMIAGDVGSSSHPAGEKKAGPKISCYGNEYDGYYDVSGEHRSVSRLHRATTRPRVGARVQGGGLVLRGVSTPPPQPLFNQNGFPVTTPGVITSLLIRHNLIIVNCGAALTASPGYLRGAARRVRLNARAIIDKKTSIWRERGKPRYRTSANKTRLSGGMEATHAEAETLVDWSGSADPSLPPAAALRHQSKQNN